MKELRIYGTDGTLHEFDPVDSAEVFHIPANVATGDIFYYAEGTLVRLPKGSGNQTLKMNAGATAPVWVT